jgi:hypothetical protein
LRGVREGADIDSHVVKQRAVRVGHYYRPPGLPRHKQSWLAIVWHKE